MHEQKGKLFGFFLNIKMFLKIEKIPKTFLAKRKFHQNCEKINEKEQLREKSMKKNRKFRQKSKIATKIENFDKNEKFFDTNQGSWRIVSIAAFRDESFSGRLDLVGR